MAYRVKFKDWLYMPQNHFGDKYNTAIADVTYQARKVKKAINNGGDSYKYFMEQYVIVSEYCIMETLRGKSPMVICMGNDDELYLCKLCFNPTGVMYLEKASIWEYRPEMGTKKKGWKAVSLKDIDQYVEVIVPEWGFLKWIR